MTQTVETVVCEACKYWKPRKGNEDCGYCSHIKQTTDYCDFCSYGEEPDPEEEWQKMEEAKWERAEREYDYARGK